MQIIPLKILKNRKLIGSKTQKYINDEEDHQNNNKPHIKKNVNII